MKDLKAVKTRVELHRPGFDLKLECDFGAGVTGIFGPSGAGKSTLLHLIAGLERPDSGRIEIADQVVADSGENIWITARKRRIGYVFQDGRLFPHMTVRKNLQFGQTLLAAGDQRIQLEEVVALLEIESLLEKKPHQLSGGERQRVAIGRALLSSPRLLLMDEPFSSLDVGLRSQIIPYLNRITRNLHIPMLVVSHDLPDLLRLTHDLLLLRKGRVVGQGNYYDLILEENLLDVMRGGGLINSIPFRVKAHDQEKGLTVLTNNGGKEEIRIVQEMEVQCCQPGDRINVSLRPEDVAITLSRVENISIRNQLSGKIQRIIQKNNRIYCLVDVGFVLIVAITEASRQNMDLHEGKEVWCLFKSMALKVNR